MFAMTQQRYGPPEVLVPTSLPEVTPGPREVVVRIAAVAATQGDLRLRSGDFPGIMWLPGRLALGFMGPRAAVGGTAFAGRVVAVGDDVARISVGDDVFGLTMSGAYAERLVVREGAAFARMPSGWSYAEAATLPYGPGTATSFLVDKVKLRAGERIAVIGAAGGVGRAVVQLGHHLGARVTAVVRSGDVGWLRECGASDITTLDALEGSFDVVFDTPGVLGPARARRWLRADGRYTTLLVTLRGLLAAALRPLWGGPRVVTGVAFDTEASMERLRALAEAGVFRPRVGRVFPLAQLAAAHACAERGGHHADVVVVSEDHEVAPPGEPKSSGRGATS